MRVSPFGKHLHSQIVWPLALASVAIGVVGAIVAVGMLDRVVDGWVDQNADGAARLVVSRIERRASEAQRAVALIAGNPLFSAPLSSDDTESVRGALLSGLDVLDSDNLMLLDASGTVIASAGRLRVTPGERPYRGDLADGAGPAIVPVAGLHTVSSVEEVGAQVGRRRFLVSSAVMDNATAERLAVGLSHGIALYDRDGALMASAVPSELGGQSLVEALARHPVASRAQEGIADGPVPSAMMLEVGDHRYRVRLRELRLGGGAGSTPVYVASIVDTGIVASARVTTARLVVVWSAIAVLALIGMNWWVARSVSEPLAELASSVARVAEGDYAAKVEASGSNEIAALAENFNQMTDSLKERSESLTKKVLELATLYEMSRALGSTLDLDALLKSVLDSAMRIFGAEVGYVTMTDRETGELRIRAQHGVPSGPDVANRLRSSMSEWVVREGRPLIFNPPRAEEKGGQTEAVSGALAALCVPLLSAEGPIGALTVGTFDQERRFTADDVRLLATIANQVTIAIGNIGLFSSVQEAYLATVRALAAAVDAKDPYTRGHSDGVAEFALMIGAKLELSPDQMVALEMAAYLHDIGKIGISEDILLKPGKLTESEMSRMRHHPLIGANILKPVAFPWPIAPVVRHHHEHYDGNGYPAGLRGDEIPLLARVLTVADAFEAMIADRPYRRGRSHQEAILELRRCAGTHFDPRVVEAFISALESVETAGSAAGSPEAEVGPEEMQAVYVAVCDGMYAGFRRLGGPRLARNLEEHVNERLRADGLPLTLNGGHLVIDDEACGSDDRLAEHLRCAVTVIAEHIEQASGAGLSDHFLAEALDALPERMRAHAAQLGLQTSV